MTESFNRLQSDGAKIAQLDIVEFTELQIGNEVAENGDRAVSRSSICAGHDDMSLKDGYHHYQRVPSFGGGPDRFGTPVLQSPANLAVVLPEPPN